MKIGNCQSRISAALAVWLCMAAFVAPASAEIYGDLDVVLESGAPGETTHGYAEYVFLVKNISPAKRFTVGIEMPMRSYGAGNHIYRISRSVVVEPNSTARLRLYQPPMSMNGEGARVVIDGMSQSKPLQGFTIEHMRDAYSYGYRHGMGQSVAVLVSQSLNVTNVQQSFTAWSPHDPMTSHIATRQFNPIAGDRPTAGWSDQWLGYTRYDGVMVSAQDMATAPAEVVGALTRYVETGGCLVVVGAWTIPTAWRQEVAGDELGAVAYLGFGEVRVVDQADPAKWGAEAWKPVYDAMLLTAQPFQAQRDVMEANKVFEVVKELGVPVNGLFLLMMLFALLIGPVNLYVLSKRDRRLWMIWTVPLISLLFCGMVFAYNLIAEGWEAHARTQAITLLDQANHRATTIGWTGFYSPLTPGGGLRFSLDTELTPQVHTEYGRGGEARAVEQTSDQHLSSGWVSARVPAIFLVRKASLERRRVDILPAEGGGYNATNGLGADIERLYYADPQGNVHHAVNITAGSTAKLEPDAQKITPGQPVGGPGDWRRLYSSANWYDVPVSRDPVLLLRGNDYAAIVTGSPFVEDGLPGATYKAVPSLVYSRLEPPKP